MVNEVFLVNVLSVLFVLVSILTVCIVWCMIRLNSIGRVIYSMDKNKSSNSNNSNKNTGMMWSYTSIKDNSNSN